MKNVIGLLGGTFDPIHYGHLRPALDLLETLPLSELRLIPSAQPPHRDEPGASAEQRLEMVRLAVADQSGFVVDDRELRREGPSYMVDTLTEFRQEYGLDKPLALIMGIDAFLGLPKWHRWQELVDLAHLIVTRRPGWTAPSEGELADLLSHHACVSNDDLNSSASGKICFVEVTQLDISATDIREHLQVGRSPRYLISEAVITYIREQELYQS